jgi:enhancing lycopene biosynthesis protein 2
MAMSKVDEFKVPSVSKSLDNTLIVNAVFIAVELTSFAAVGFIFAAAPTVIVTVAVAHKAGEPLSQISYTKVVTPVKPVVGMKVIVPLAFTIAVPLFEGIAMLKVEEFNVPSVSKSLDNTLIVIAVFIAVELTSFAAVGFTFAGAPTVIVTVPVEHKAGEPLSQISYTKVVTPVNPAFGVKVIVPFAFTTAVPFVEGVTIDKLEFSIALSASESLAKMEQTTAVFCVVEKASFAAIGLVLLELISTTQIPKLPEFVVP